MGVAMLQPAYFIHLLRSIRGYKPVGDPEHLRNSLHQRLEK
jgi:hypothetical protein